MVQAYGVDISRFQYLDPVLMDFNKLIAHPNKPRFIGIRTGISWAYIDAWFARSWIEAKRVSLFRMPYHVIYFGENATAQVDNMFRIIGNDVDWEHDKPVLDLEVAGSNTKARCTATTAAVMEIIKQRIGFYPINYSRAAWINEHLVVNDLPECDWWMASYLTELPYPAFTPERQSPPYMPIGLTKWLIHQTSGKGDGKTHGAASHYIDQNRWNGDDDAVDAYFGMSVEPPVALTLEGVDGRLKVVEGMAHTHANMPIVMN